MTDIQERFEKLHEGFQETLRPTDIEVRRADGTLVFWKEDQRVGLEITKTEVNQLVAHYEDESWEQVSNRILRDAYAYLVLKYL